MTSAQKQRITLKIYLALSVVIAGWVMWESLRLVRSDLISAAAREKIGQWNSNIGLPSSIVEWSDARQKIEKALEIGADDPAFYELEGDLYLIAIQANIIDADEREMAAARAITYYQKSLQLRPTEPQTWAAIATAYFVLGADTTEMQTAWSRALALGPYEGHVQPVLMDLALATWPDVSVQMQRWVQHAFETASPASRKEINRIAMARGLQLKIADTDSRDASQAAPDEASATPH